MEIAPRFATLVASIEAGDAHAGVTSARQLMASGLKAYDIFQEAIVPCLRVIGDRFGRGECFLPELIYAAEVVTAVQTAVKEEFHSEAVQAAGRIVIGTVFGDVHDIGKNIVAAMLRANGFEVIDLGVDVPARAFLKSAREVDADIVALSSLMSTSVPYMADAIDLIRDAEADGPRLKILVGGGPLTAATARQIGADGYGADAVEAVAQARALLACGAADAGGRTR